MVATTPFHERLAPLNTTGLWSHWSGRLAAVKYQMAEKFEYFAIRNAAALIDTSPLYKYRITGPDAERFLAGMLARDIRACRDGQAQYTLWCDDRGFVIEDGVVFRHSSDHFLLTAAEPWSGNYVVSPTVHVIAHHTSSDAAAAPAAPSTTPRSCSASRCE